MKGNGSLSSRAYDVQHWSPLVLAERRVTYNDTMVPVIGYDSLDVFMIFMKMFWYSIYLYPYSNEERTLEQAGSTYSRIRIQRQLALPGL